MTATFIDGDSHFYEPIEIFAQYADPAIRNHAPQWINDETGALRVRVGNKLYPSAHTHPSGLGWVLGEDSPFRQIKGAYDPSERLKFMDAEGVEMAIIYPTLGMNGFSAIDDPKVAGGLCRAYNRWVAEFASPAPKRLRSAMLVPLNHPEVALAELKYARETLGLSIVFANPTPIPGLNWHHPAYDSFWAAAQDSGVLFTFHKGTAGTPNATGLDRYKMYPMTYLCGHVVERWGRIGCCCRRTTLTHKRATRWSRRCMRHIRGSGQPSR
ncbi:MAG: amidohydrolase family protein [Deltaproteobacteria bacterium]|nr:amidohydrolase family protein [Deltaproteobacteria bacterium]